MENNVMKYLFYLIILNIITLVNNNKIIIPLKRINNPDKSISYIESLLQNQLYAEITLGTPEQKIYLSITTETDSFSIESKSINDKFYIHNKSSSYINTNKRLSFYHERYKEGYVFKEKFYFKNLYEKDVQQPYNNISFNYILELSEDYKKNEKIYYIDNNQNQISGTIGLQILKTYTSSSHFINSLSYIGAINKNIWSLIYSHNEDNKAVLIIGENPFQISFNSNNDNAKRASAYLQGTNSLWYFLFSDIKTGDKKLNEIRLAEYAPQIGVIIGTDEYKTYIKNNFFENLKKENKCNENNINIGTKTYLYYECDKDININNFENILFIHQEFSYNFTLDKNDLFVEFNNKIYFLVIFLEKDYSGTYYSVKKWVFGTPFVKKYNFIFDHNSKVILFYENILYGIEKGKVSVFIWIFIIALGIFAALAAFYIIIKIILRPKKILAHELEDSFNYNSQKNTNKETDLSYFYHAKYNKLGI